MPWYVVLTVKLEFWPFEGKGRINACSGLSANCKKLASRQCTLRISLPGYKEGVHTMKHVQRKHQLFAQIAKISPSKGESDRVSKGW